MTSFFVIPASCGASSAGSRKLQPGPPQQRLGIAAIRPLFSRMMANPDWLQEEFRRTSETGGMGKCIANWLLYRDTEGTLSLPAVVTAPGSDTTVHSGHTNKDGEA